MRRAGEPTMIIPDSKTYDYLGLMYPMQPVHHDDIMISPTPPVKKLAVPKPKVKKAANIIAAFPAIKYYPVQSAAIPLPPKWSIRKDETVKQGAPFKLFSVGPKTSEYATIAALMDPYPISDVEQIVNPMLWSRFENYRKDMLRTKSNDIKLLSQFKFNEKELYASFQSFYLFESSPEVEDIPYSDNIVLLFHCTRSPASIKDILIQGLDERMGKNGGLLGKGIYFTDNPAKSMAYDGTGGTIFIFAVLLGDCSSIDHLDDKNLVREPQKIREQQRNPNDSFFDSVVATPGRGGDNEYVVYNRLQCYPLYKISYAPAPAKKAKVVAGDIKLYMETRKNLPPFSWIIAKSNKDGVHFDWPFYAKTLFEKMGAGKENELSETLTINEAITKPPNVNPRISNCPICGNQCVNRVKYWNVLQCGHKICTECYQKYAITRTTMSGESHSFIKCPTCKRTSGIEVGNCPLGRMNVTRSATPCAGHELFPSIVINYIIDNGHNSIKLNSTAYLPSNVEGNEILKLLTIAWDRRICITFNTDMATGGVQIFWNIPHKASRSGGTRSGYPDKDYFKTVKSALKLYGIE